MAKSRAIWTPAPCALFTRRRKPSRVPSSGCTAVWPPSAEPMAHGLPRSPAPAPSVLSGPLRAGGWAAAPPERAAARGRVGPGEGLRAADHRGALQQLAREVGLAARDAPAHLLPPRAEGVGPGLDGVAVAGVGLEAEHAAPAVVVDRLQGRFPPGRLVVGAVADPRGQQIVALPGDVRGGREGVAHDALARVPAVGRRVTRGLDGDG